MNQFRSLLPVLLLSLLAACASLSGGMEKPEFHVINIEPMQTDSMFEQRAKVTLRIINPNDTALEVTGFSFHMDLNDTRFTRGVSDAHFTVPRLGEATTSVVVTTTVIDFARQIMALEGRESPNYLIEGKVYLGGSRIGSVPFSYSGELTEKH